MAKKIDTSKIERIRQASVEIISECGITGSSVAAIAQRAGVSAGYLYRHYPSKVKLVNDLLNDALNSITERIDALIGENDRIDRIVSGIIGFIFESASLNPYRLKFQIMLLNDFSTKIDPAIREQIRQIGETLIRKGHENGSEKCEYRRFLHSFGRYPDAIPCCAVQIRLRSERLGYRRRN